MPATRRGRILLALCAVVAALAALVWASSASLPDGRTTLANGMTTQIRISGLCTPEDAIILAPRESMALVWAGRRCVVDEGDSASTLGCIEIAAPVTSVTQSSLEVTKDPERCFR